MDSKGVNEEAAEDVTNGALGTALTKKKTSSTREAKYKRSVKRTPEEPQGAPKETNVLVTISSGMKMIQWIVKGAMCVGRNQSNRILTFQCIVKDPEEDQNIWAS